MPSLGILLSTFSNITPFGIADSGCNPGLQVVLVLTCSLHCPSNFAFAHLPVFLFLVSIRNRDTLVCLKNFPGVMSRQISYIIELPLAVGNSDRGQC